MPDADPGHIPVLLQEVIDLLDPQPGRSFLDGTLGRGGHAAALIPRLAGGRYLGLDRDPENTAYARRRLQPLADQHDVTLDVRHASFAEADALAAAAGGVDGLLADLGFASNQMDDPARGFSFMADGPLDMRLDPTAGPPAEQLVNSLPERELADLIYHYGEERLSRRVARRIVERRGQQPIVSTHQLAEICKRAYPPPRGRKSGPRIHPATRTFQALRIAVNGELDALHRLLEHLPRLLKPGGRAAIISFHSLEDRPVKRAFLQMQQDGLAERLTRKPVTAAPEELAENPRARSAKLRGIRRIQLLPKIR